MSGKISLTFQVFNYKKHRSDLIGFSSYGGYVARELENGTVILSNWHDRLAKWHSKDQYFSRKMERQSL